MTRAWKQNNPQRRCAKLPTPVYLAIRKQFAKGRTQTETSEVVSIWAQRRGLPGVSRQTVNRHFQEIGYKLWVATYYLEFGLAPEPGAIPYAGYEPVSKNLLYFTHEGARQHREYHWKQFKKPPSGKAFDNPIISKVRAASTKMNGIRGDKFYVQYARAEILRYIERAYPSWTERRSFDHLFAFIVEIEKTLVIPESIEEQVKEWRRIHALI